MTDQDILDKAAAAFGGTITDDEPAEILDNSAFADLIGFKADGKELPSNKGNIMYGRYKATFKEIKRFSGAYPSGDTYDEFRIELTVKNIIDAKVEGEGLRVKGKVPTTSWALKAFGNKLKNAGYEIDLSEAGDENEASVMLEKRLAELAGKDVDVTIKPKISWRKGSIVLDDDGMPFIDENKSFSVRKKGDFDVGEESTFIQDGCPDMVGDKIGRNFVEDVDVISVENSGYVNHTFEICAPLGQ